MTSRNLQIFVTVAELGKMTEAARVLYITQSSVSQAIASIEQEYGVVLFERLSRVFSSPTRARNFSTTPEAISPSSRTWRSSCSARASGRPLR